MYNHLHETPKICKSKKKIKEKLTVAERRWGRMGIGVVGTEFLFQMMTFRKWMMVMAT